jgi:hypothetical protein
MQIKTPSPPLHFLTGKQCKIMTATLKIELGESIIWLETAV